MLTIDDKAEIIMECMRQAFEQENGLKQRHFQRIYKKRLLFVGSSKVLRKLKNSSPQGHLTKYRIS